MKDLVRPPGERIVDSIGFENQYCYDKSIKMIDIKCSVAQLQAFVAVAEEGSFSAAARLLDKGQPAISTSISNLEATLGLQLFDRSERLPVLTSGGQALLSEARKFLYQAKQVQLTAENWVSADKARRLSIVIDVICPVHKTVRLIEQLYSRYPDLSLTLHTEARGAVTARAARRPVRETAFPCISYRRPSRPFGKFTKASGLGRQQKLFQSPGREPTRAMPKHIFTKPPAASPPSSEARASPTGQ